MANVKGSKHTVGTPKTTSGMGTKSGGGSNTRGTKHTTSGGVHPPIHKLPLDRGTNMSSGSDNMGHHPNGEHKSDCAPGTNC